MQDILHELIVEKHWARERRGGEVLSLKEATMIERYVVFRVECARSRCFIGVLSLNAFVFLRHEATIDSTGFIPADLYSRVFRVFVPRPNKAFDFR